MMSVNVNTSASPDRHASTSSRDISSQTEQLTIRQQRFERMLAQQLDVDAAGLAAMDHLISAGEATPTELARRLDISTAAMTLVLNRLEAAGHIERGAHPTDRRKVVISAAAPSVESARTQVQPLIDGVEKLVASMTPAEQATVSTFLDAMIAIYDEAMRDAGR